MTYSVCLQCSCTEQTKTLQIYFQLVTLFALSEFLLRQTCGEVCLSVLCLIYFLLLLNLCISDSKHAETKTHTHKRKVHIHSLSNVNFSWKFSTQGAAEHFPFSCCLWSGWDLSVSIKTPIKSSFASFLCCLESNSDHSLHCIPLRGTWVSQLLSH